MHCLPELGAASTKIVALRPLSVQTQAFQKLVRIIFVVIVALDQMRPTSLALVGAYFGREDSAAVFFKEWDAYRDGPFEYRKGESWDRLFHQGVHLLEIFARDNRVRIRNPKQNLQIKMLQALLDGSEFVSYLDSIGEIDGQHCLIDWKTTTSRYSTEPE